MSIGLIAALFGSSISGWVLGRLHLKATSLKALDRALKLQDGTLEKRINDAEGAAVDKEISKLGQ